MSYHIQKKKKTNNRTKKILDPEEGQRLDFFNKDCEQSVLNMLES